MNYLKTYCFLHDDAEYIRRSVFVDEQGFAKEFDDKDAIARHVVLYNGKNEPVATCRYFSIDEGKVYGIGRLAVLKEFRKNDCGTAVLREVEQQIEAVGGAEIRLAAQLRAKGFYEKSGYTAVGEEFTDENCPHIWMFKKLKGGNGNG